MDLAPANGWRLLTTPFGVEETVRNLQQLSNEASEYWEGKRSAIVLAEDILTLEWPAIFQPAKDKPILFGALAWADVLLTLDQVDFIDQIGTDFYGLPILRPGQFLSRQRIEGTLIEL